MDLERPASDPGGDGAESWAVSEQPRLRDGSRLNFRHDLKKGALAPAYKVVLLREVPQRVAKYDVRLRAASLRAVQAMHTILTQMVFFKCNCC